MKTLRGMFSKGNTAGPLPPPPPEITADNVRLFNSLGLGWNIGPDSTYYEILNIAPDADDTAINDGFRVISNTIRPLVADYNAPERRGYFRLRIFIREICDKLLDPAQRQEYDELLRLHPKVPPPVPPSPPPSPLGTPRGPVVPPPPPPVPPLVPPPVARGTNVTFAGSQVPNPILKQSGPVPQSILQTNVGRILVDFIDVVEKEIANKARRPTPDQRRLEMNVLHTTEKMLEYPESSNLENYVLLTLFFENAANGPLVLALHDRLQEKKSRFENPYDVNENFQETGVPQVVGKIEPPRFFSLMILSSRMCTKYKLRSNPECELFLRLNELFQEGNGPNFNSRGIFDVLDNFIKTNSAVTSDYVKRLANGERMYEIYRNNYFQADREISKQLIKERLDRWLKVVEVKDFVIDVPVTYLFNKYSNKEKERLNKEASICETIANFSDKIGKPNIAYPLLPPSAFNIEQNDSVDFDKINEYLYKISPAAVKKKADKLHRRSLRKKNKLGKP